jgi:hypothetical protein
VGKLGLKDLVAARLRLRNVVVCGGSRRAVSAVMVRSIGLGLPKNGRLEQAPLN